MLNPNPFQLDPSNTSAFKAICIDEHPSSVGELKAVVVGGGTGAPVVIRTVLSMGMKTSAVVAMADDGGSTGILREAANVTPPGDIRKCIAAFAKDPTDPLTRAFKYRLNIANGHALGNLILSTLEDACGSFSEAIDICERLVNAKGHVFPSTLNHVTLNALTKDGKYIQGQAQASHASCALHQVSLKSEDERISANPKALKALKNADLIILGPGSLFTSIIANLLVPGIIDAIKQSNATTIFICSVADVQGETWGLSAKEHVEALLNHGMHGLLDYVLINDSSSSNASDIQSVYIDDYDLESIQSLGPMVIKRNLCDPNKPLWHEPSALRDAIFHVISLSKLDKIIQP